MPKKKIDIPRSGPFITVEIRHSCRGCVHQSSKSYRVQGDSGIDSYCNEPSQDGRETGLNVWETPQWCPFRG